MSIFYHQWLQEAGFTQQEKDAINRGRKSFYDAMQAIKQARKRSYDDIQSDNADKPDKTTEIITRMIAKETVKVLSAAERWAERWPEEFRRGLNMSLYPDNHEDLIPFFKTWTRPRDKEKQKEATSVWATMIAFLVFHWHGYGEDRELESMGLEMSWGLKDCIDDIRSHAKKATPTVLGTAIKVFLIRTITNAKSTPRTNPLSW